MLHYTKDWNLEELDLGNNDEITFIWDSFNSYQWFQKISSPKSGFRQFYVASTS